MGDLYNTKEMTGLRQKLRVNFPKAEAVLWEKLRKKRCCNTKFRRQHSFNRYVVDFYSTKYRLVIEIDGPTHNSREARKYDKIREEYLESLNLNIIRFTNYEVYNEIELVLFKLKERINKLELAKEDKTIAEQ